MTLKMDWKTFALFVFAFLWTNRDEVAQRYQDIKKGGVQPDSFDNSDLDLETLDQQVYSKAKEARDEYRELTRARTPQFNRTHSSRFTIDSA